MAGPSGSSRPFLAAAPTIRRFCGWLAPARDYPAIRDAAWKLLQAEHVNEVLKASYAHLIVDEYQDCSVPQHYIVYFL